MGVGSGWSGSGLLIRGLKSRFAGHPYKFGDDTHQQLMTSDLKDIHKRRVEF
jgi:hypothetical protein